MRGSFRIASDPDLAMPHMTDSPRFTLNRNLVVLVPKEPFLQWVLEADPKPLNLTLEELREDPDAFLISESTAEFAEDARRWVEHRWQMFFEHVLVDWYTDESLWPKKRSLKMFREWFDIQYHSMVWDLAVREPLELEDWGDEEAENDPS